MMLDYEITDKASALYAGGWRSEDRTWMMDEYNLTEDEANAICEWFEEFERRDQEC